MSELLHQEGTMIGTTRLSSPLRIAIQGVQGAFHDIAARRFFGDQVEIVPAETFDRLVQLCNDANQTDLSLMAIENTIAGSILTNYNYLFHHNIQIIGEVGLRIRQHLMALDGVSIVDLEEVHSHPVALAQCAAFFESYPHIRLVESKDTAMSAAWIKTTQKQHVGAIGSSLAADLYGLKVLAAGIETFQQNYTRFLVLQRGKHQKVREKDQKASVGVTLSHTPGSLSQLLNLLNAHGVDLTKIQSIPLLDHPWEYRFLLDFTAETNYILQSAIDELNRATFIRQLHVFGTYPSGIIHEQ